MSKKLYFLISFVLVLSLGGLAQAANPIEVNNASFEIAADGVNTVPAHTGYEGILDWSYNYPTGAETPWVGVDVFCPYADDAHCHHWPASDGVVYSYIQAGGGNAYQVLDMNNSDANGVIVAGRKYVLTYDAMGWDGDEHTASFFCPNDVFQPDVDHNELASETYALRYIERDLEDCDCESKDGISTLCGSDCPDWDYGLTVTFVAEAGQFYIGKTLGLKIKTEPAGSWTFIDNIEVEWSWVSNAYDPDPADEAENTPMDVILAWSPGLWAVGDANGHEVYFGTSWADVDSATTATPVVYRGTGALVSGPDANNRYSYDFLETLELGRPYFWRIDEVNEDWVDGPVPPVNDRWKGDVWGFRTMGYAYNVYPADGADDIPALNLILRWTAGIDANEHDVYFGSDEAAVEDANTSNTATYPGVYRGTQPLSDVNYLVEDLAVGIDYFWRIDEANTTTLVTGDVWGFKTGVFILVDSFEWYQTTQELRDAWKDFYFNPGGTNRAELFIESTDVNKFLHPGEQSMKYYYRNFKVGGTYYHAWAEADLPLEVGTDWTVAGVKALAVHYCGDPCNGKEATKDYAVTDDQMWLELVDGGANAGIVRLPKMSNITDGEWHTWDISLIDPNFSAVDMSNVAKVYIGFGGAKGGKTKTPGAGSSDLIGDTVWFDDISLYPPRCMPETTGLDVIHALGDFTGPFWAEDCNTDYFDLEMMAADWMKIDGLVSTENQPAVLSEFAGTTAHWDPNGHIGGAIEVNNVEGDKIDVLDPRLPGLTNMSITGWVKGDGPQQKYCALVASREAPGGATELMVDNGSGVSYGWNGDYWSWKSGIVIPDGAWAFIALAVEPTQATVYMHTDPCDTDVMSSATNVEDHETLVHFVTQFRIGRSNPDNKQFKGLMDDVRVYDWTLTEANMEQLVHETGEPNSWPIYWYKFDETEGLVAADSGFGTDVYSKNILPTNIVPKDPCDSEDPNLATGAVDPNNLDIINFLDYTAMAENWLMGPWLWPAVP